MFVFIIYDIFKVNRVGKMEVTLEELKRLIDQLPKECYQSVYDYLQFLIHRSVDQTEDPLPETRGIIEDESLSFEDYTGVDLSMFTKK